MTLRYRMSLFAALALGLGVSTAVAAGNGAIERPAPSRPVSFGKPVELRPNHDLAATLNAIIAAQIAAQDGSQADTSNPYRLPRPRPDREYLVETAKGG
ncbi:MAG: hypothetical protein M9939_17415 [Mesorhizobium sp.]|nr:hypothetical protein [Mesorhizobium sp.]MCO5162917.1 hypothetical protein [Mesorhizobium sp.]